MLKVVIGVFLILHGGVHLLYAGHSLRLFELQPELPWPDGAWAFTRPLGQKATRVFTAVSLALVAAGFIASGVAMFSGFGWFKQVVMTTAWVSTGLYFLLWNGELETVDDQGAGGILINLIILAAQGIFNWPPVG